MSEPTSYMPPPAQPMQFQSAPPQQSNGVGIAAMVLGIIAIVVAFIPILGMAALPLGGLAVILGIVGLVLKGRKRGTAIAGLVLGIVSVIIALVAMAFTAVALSAAGEAVKEADKSDVLVLQDGWKVEQDGPFAKVVGQVANTSDKPVNTLATISFDVLDASGANTGSCLDTTNTIDAGGKWKFEAICTGDVTSSSKVRFKDITGF